MQSTKGKEWTVNEHKLFLLGLEKYGKGDWKGISREYVKSRTPSQVASHAQKFFLRLKSKNTTKKRSRSSIHDITSVDPEDALVLFGQVASPPNNVAQISQTHAVVATSEAGSYSTAFGQPIDGPLAFDQHLCNPNVGSYSTVIGQPIDGPLSLDEHTSFLSETVPGLCELSEEDLDDIISYLYEPPDQRMSSLLDDFDFVV